MYSRSCCQRWQLTWLGTLFGASLIAFVLTLVPALAHEGHDHGDQKEVATVASTFPRVATRSDLYEVVAILKEGRLSITVDDAKTNAPVSDARLQLTIGDKEAVEAAAVGQGMFSAPHPELPLGDVDIIFSVTGKAGDDLLVGTLQLASADDVLQVDRPVGRWAYFAGILFIALGVGFAALRSRKRWAAPMIAVAMIGCFVLAVIAVVWRPLGHSVATPVTGMSDAPRRLPDGTIYAAKPTQRLLDVRTELAQQSTARPASQLIGTVIANPDRSSIVQSLYGGRIMAVESALPRIGQTVAKGDVLVQIEPYLPVADRTTIAEKEGEIEQSIAIAETKLRRLRPLAADNAVPMGQIYDLETELEGLRTRRETVRTLRADREILRAPTDGIITSTNVVPGKVIQPQDVLFQIADPKGLWVEAFAYSDNAQALAFEATAKLGNGQSFALSYLGTSRALRQHASVVHFAVPEPPVGLNIGQPVAVLVQSGQPTTGFILPRDAIVTTGSGESIVWAHTAPERFEPKPVRSVPVDATRVLIASGLDGGERVVVRGSGLINQVR